MLLWSKEKTNLLNLAHVAFTVTLERTWNTSFILPISLSLVLQSVRLLSFSTAPTYNNPWDYNQGSYVTRLSDRWNRKKLSDKIFSLFLEMFQGGESRCHTYSVKAPSSLNKVWTLCSATPRNRLNWAWHIIRRWEVARPPQTIKFGGYLDFMTERTSYILKASVVLDVVQLILTKLFSEMN